MTTPITNPTTVSGNIQLETHQPIGNLQVDSRLVEFINEEALPLTAVDRERFWDGFVSVFTQFSADNRALLQERERLQSAIDAYHQEHPGAPEPTAYQQFLRDIGYLHEEPTRVWARTHDVDKEIAQMSGPQLVVPITNLRFSINAANARWGSLYDALYGTDVISEDGGAEKGRAYNPVRGDRVIAWA